MNTVVGVKRTQVDVVVAETDTLNAERVGVEGVGTEEVRVTATGVVVMTEITEEEEEALVPVVAVVVAVPVVKKTVWFH